MLRVTTDDPTSFVLGKRTIRVVFMFENPFSGDDIHTGGTRNKRPCAVLKEHVVLIFHSLTLMRVMEGDTIGLGTGKT